jgi:hypothetical protein
MSSISRRATFGAALYAFPLAVVPSLAKAYGVDMEANLLAEKMADLHGGEWRAIVDHDAGFILIKPRPRPNPKQPVSV